MDIGVALAGRVVEAVHAAFGLEITAAEAALRPSTHADYQCNAAMGLAKRLGHPPREIAARLAEQLAGELIEPPQVSGPGFINLTLRHDWLEQRVAGLLGDNRLGVPITDAPRRIAVDYSSPNVAKEMHVGHLRSTIIGDALLRLLRFAGHDVVPHNHLGDWGTPFGMLIEHLVDDGWDAAEAGTISDLNGFYQAARAKFDADPAFADRSRARVVLLQSGDHDTLALWQRLVDESTRHFEAVYAMLGVRLTPTDLYPESHYNPYLAEVVAELERRGLTEISDGAVCVFPPGFRNRDGDRLPLIVRKRDGGFGYAATDLATVWYWAVHRGMTDLLYVVGNPQAAHFEMIFDVARRAGWLTGDHRTAHIGFGTILGADGKTIRTRAGGAIKLAELLTEAVTQAEAVLAERSTLEPARQAEVARAVGIGAVKYADLSNDRAKDYTFSWARMLAKEGDTSVYLQYAHVRTRSVLRAAGELPPPGSLAAITEPAERALAVQLVRLPEAIAASVDGYAPHKLCAYLYRTAVAFSAFYENCPILSDATSPEVRRSRLMLTQVTANVLALGLSLLGIAAPEQL